RSVRKNTQKALMAVEAATQNEGVKGRAEKLLNIFQSDLFQALIGGTSDTFPHMFVLHLQQKL
uniref:L27-1 domain-containing protein n=1 Tax=Neogobius melanostomus TaxID=47308 RepID=A0A8C6X004_9GOBI